MKRNETFNTAAKLYDEVRPSYVNRSSIGLFRKQESPSKHVFFVFLIIGVCLMFVSPLAFTQSDKEVPGFTVHADKQYIEVFKQIFPQYVRMGSNWKFRDSNSVFVHIIGDSLRVSDIYLFPGKYAWQLEEKTEQQGIVFWKSRPSLLWISAKDVSMLRTHLRENAELRQMIGEVARNPYVKDSYANITGKDEAMRFEDFNAAGFGERIMQRYTLPTEGNIAGIYDLDTIQYDRPALYYLRRGLQSTLKKEYLQEIHTAVGNIQHNWSGVLKLLHYYERTFEGSGITDYRVSANDLYTSKRIGGCTQEALMVASILRGFGFPAVLVYTVDLEEARKTPLGQTISKGHQMVEVFVDPQWVLIAGSRKYTKQYDPYNPYIVRYKPGSWIARGFVLGKGLDYWDMGITYKNAKREMETEFLKRLDTIEPFLEHENACHLRTY